MPKRREPVQWLMDFAKNADVTIGSIVRDFGNLRRRPPKSCCAQFYEARNTKRNRYGDVPCLELNRLHLDPTRDGSDYIHANLVTLPGLPGSCILTQTPMTETVPDFWSTVWRQNVRTIIYVPSDDGEPTNPYWSKVVGFNHRMSSGQFIVHSNYGEEHRTYAKRMLQLTNEDYGETRQIRHYVYKRDNGLSADDLLHFAAAIRGGAARGLREVLSASATLLVHDAAGTGGSAVLVSLLSLMSTVDSMEAPKVGATVNLLRSQRALALDKLENYFLLNVTLAKYILDNCVPSGDDSRPHINDALTVLETCAVPYKRPLCEPRKK